MTPTVWRGSADMMHRHLDQQGAALLDLQEQLLPHAARRTAAHDVA